MSHLKINLIFLFLLTCLGLSAQMSENEYIVYTTNKGDVGAVDNVADIMNSSVLDYPASNGNLALLKWDEQPFYYGGEYITDLITVVEKIKGTDNSPPVIDIDGSGINFHYNPPSNGNGNPPNSTSCGIWSSDIKYPGERITVGIFDTGLNYEIAQDNGYVFNEVISVGNIQDENGHGTHVGTIIDQIYHENINNNLSYVIGGAFGSAGNSSIYGLINSIESALVQFQGDLNIVNFSFTYPLIHFAEGDPFFELLASPEYEDILFICAAGNDGYNIDGGTVPSGANGEMAYSSPSYYPAAFNLENILSVGSYKCVGNKIYKSDFSNFGVESVDMAASGEYIAGLNHLGETVWKSGTSQATAVVTGAAAAIKSKFPELSPSELKCLILALGADVETFNQYFKHGKVLHLDNVLKEKNLPNCDLLGTNTEGGFYGLNSGSANASDEHITLYPIPFNDELSIDYFSDYNTSIAIDIYSIDGQLVQSFSKKAIKGTNTFVLNFNNIAFSNQYVLRITSNDKTETRKVSRF